MKFKLEDICSYYKKKVEVSNLTLETYVSTENMLPNKIGVVNASSLPSTKSMQAFEEGDILVSNIRPYFKKIWKAKFNGGCSNDVLVFKANENIDSDFLYYVLADDAFFTYAMASSKGTKMPRGDKTSIMQYEVPDYDVSIQKKIARILKRIDDKIELNNKINNNLEEQAQALFRKLFLGNNKYKTIALGNITKNIRDRIGNNKATVLSAVNVGKLQPSDDFFKKRVYSKDTSKYITVKEGSFAYNPARINIGSIGINDLGTKGCVSPVYVVFDVDSDYRSFFEFYFKTAIFKAETMLRASGSVRQSLNYNDFALIDIKYPDRGTAQFFNKFWTKQKSIISHLNRENERLSELRDTLLPKLMSGEIDVSKIII